MHRVGMSFLAPLYLIAGLAIAGPILFHLIRRTPRGRQAFSSLMFLEPSPPRMTKRSRIEDWLVLLLRGLALILLALAFARPFWRVQAMTTAEQDAGREIVLLIDTSASMQRDDLWQQAIAQVNEKLANVDPRDTVSCLVFGNDVRELMSAESWQALPAAERVPFLVESLGKLSPTWEASHLAKALQQAAERLDSSSASQRTLREVCLISDMQKGSDWDQLQGYRWPEGVTLNLLPVGQGASMTNVGLQVVESELSNDDIVRIRVSNSARSAETLFLLSWASEFGAEAPTNSEQHSESLPVYVPAGQSRVVRAPARPETGHVHRLLLTGDDHAFDNTCYVARKAVWQASIVWLGESGTSDASPRFFLEPLFPQLPRRHIDFVDWIDSEPEQLPERAALIICGTQPTPRQTNWMKSQLELGSTVLYVARSAEQAIGVFPVLNSSATAITEDPAADYYMLGDVDLSHPVMRVFDDPRFSDFTKLKFWKRRAIENLELKDGQIVWQFDDQLPALVHWKQKSGNLFLLASSWSREDSELALWTKFPPFMNSILELGRPPSLTQLQFVVGSELPLETILPPETADIFVQRGSEEPRQLSRTDSIQFDRPGMTRLASTRDELATSTLELAVNLAAAESEITPLSVADFEAMGVQLDSNLQEAAPTDPSLQRQLMNTELESQQQWWRWLLVTVLILLLAETILSARKVWQEAGQKPASA